MSTDIDTSQYPSRWSQYIGQERAIRQLKTAAVSARKRRVPLPHTLIAHPSPGIGKTALAYLAGETMGKRCKVVTVQGRVTAGDARFHMSAMSDGDILFIDEAHQMGKKAEWLLPYLQDGHLIGPFGPETYAAVTVIAATTNPELLPAAVRSRFPLQPQLTDYTDVEGQKIAALMARSVLGDLPRPTRNVLTLLASAANNNPRTMRMILTNVRDLAVAEGAPADGNYDLSEPLAWAGVTSDGLSSTAEAYLSVMTEYGGQAGAALLKERLDVPDLRPVERLLADKGLVARTRGGRVLTQSGIQRALEVAA